MLQHLAPVCNYVDGLISLTKNWTNPGIAICNPGEVIGVSRLWMDLSFAPINIINRALINYLCPLPRSPLALPASSEIAPIQPSIPSSWRKELQSIAIGYASTGNNPRDGEPLPAVISEPEETEVAIAVVSSIKPLIAAIQQVKKAIASRPYHPILGNVLLVANGNDLSLTATDLHLTVSVDIPGAAVGVGSVCVPPKIAMDLLKKVKGKVTLSVLPGESPEFPIVAIAHNNGTIKIQGMSAESFPETPSASSLATIALDADFLRLIEQLKPAISRNETQPQLCGINFASCGDGILHLTAGDGHQIAKSYIEGIGYALLDATIPIELFPSAKNACESFKLGILDDCAYLQNGNVRTVVKLRPPGFPNVARLGCDAANNISVNRQALINQLEIALAYDSKKPRIYLQSNPFTQRLDCQMDFGDGYQMTAWVKAENFIDRPIGLAVDTEYLRNILKASKAENVTLNLAGSVRGVRLISVIGDGIVNAIAALDIAHWKWQPKQRYKEPTLTWEAFARALQPVHPSWQEMLGNIGEERQALAPTLRLCPSPERLPIAA
jgi:DNA polymerase-3 subunit beta